MYNYICSVEIETEIRMHVDELMRQELKNLKMVSHKLSWMSWKYVIYIL